VIKEAIKRWGTKNLGLKILSVITAGIIWFHVVTERSYETQVKVPIKWKTLSEGIVVTKEPPGSVEVRIRGKGKELVRFSKKLEINLSFSKEEVGWRKIILKEENIKMPQRVKFEVVELIGPKSFVIRIEKKGKKTVPIVPKIEGKVKIKLLPTRTKITALRRKLRRITKIETQEIKMKKDSVWVKLQIPEGVESEVESVLVILRKQ
jgi:hypothetical protein